MIGDSVAFLKRLGPRGGLRRRALLRRLPARPRLRARDARRRCRGRRRLAGAVRHQRRQLPDVVAERGARGPRRASRRRSASTRTTTRGLGGRERAGRGARRLRPGAGHDQRLWRALRQHRPRPARSQRSSSSSATRSCRPTSLRRLTEVSQFVAAVANQHPDPHAPYVGRSAFAHKGGIHVAAVAKLAESYQHVDPAAVGNEMRVVVSEVAGRRQRAAPRRGAGARRPASGGRGAAADQGARAPGLPVRGRRRLVRDAGPARRAGLPRAVRAGGLHRDRREAGRRREPGAGDRAAPGRRRDDAHGRRGRRAGQRARPGGAQGAAARTTPRSPRSTWWTTRSASWTSTWAPAPGRG